MFSEVLNSFTEWLTPLSALLIVILCIVEKTDKLVWKPITRFFKWLGSTMTSELKEAIDDMRDRQLAQEAYFLNDFYHRFKNDTNKTMTREQFENAILMFKKHIECGANSVNKDHLAELEEYYKNHFWTK